MVIKKVLISGAGIAGLTLAWWLKKYGFDPTIVEIAPSLRRGGYMIDFWGVGFDVAEKMGLLNDLSKAHYSIDEIKFVNEKNKAFSSLNINKLRSLLDYRHFNFLRGDLAQILHDHLDKSIEIVYNNSIRSLQQSKDDVAVTFSNGTLDTYDLVIGADGVHSKTRSLLFDSNMNFERFLGYYTASYTIDNFLNEDRMFSSYTIPGKQVGVYSVHKDKLATFFIWKSDPLQYSSTEEKKNLLRNAFKNVKWLTSELLAALDQAPDFYFDSVSQVVLDTWYDNRVTLVGDASHSVSLIAGEGAGLSMAGAYTLAGELNEWKADYQTALENYQNIMKPEILRKQKFAQSFAKSFVPDSKLGIWSRDIVTKFMFIPGLSERLIKRFLTDELVLKKY